MTTKQSNYLDPIAAAEQPRKDFIRYLLTAYPLRDPHLRYGLKQQLEQPGTIWQYPYMEGSQPYQTTKSVEELVELGVLHPEVAHLFTPAQRPLYRHQEQAVRTAVEQQQNLVVATGTGSGKTECFLIPMIDRLLKEGEASLRAESGVRVLILYPMNALVNDQVKRLRQLLCRQKQPLIRFGFYTSRTERDSDKAQQALQEELEAYDPEELKKLFKPDELRSPDLHRPESLVRAAVQKIRDIQAISREQMWENPPHILLTNYSMLEHMLIRPKERKSIFESSRKTFQLLVVDEAHTYDGSTGTEVSMLLKRLKAAVGIHTTGRIRCIATSASLGDASVNPTVIKFAEELFGEPFSQVVRGDRVSAIERLGNSYRLPADLADEPLWEYLQALALPALSEPIEKWSTELSYFVPSEQLQAAKDKVADVKPTEDKLHQFLWFALKQHPLVHRLIDILSQGPQPWYKIARSTQLWGTELPKTFDGSFDPKVEQQLEQALAYLVQLGTLARENPNDLPLLPVRLHLLFRSIEGLYACINPKCPGTVSNPNSLERPPRYGQLYLSERATCEHEACQSPVLELASCRKCGQAYSLACLKPESRGAGLLRSLPRSLEAIANSKQVYTLTTGALDSVTEDEAIDAPEEDNNSPLVEGTFLISKAKEHAGWLGMTMPKQALASASESHFVLNWHIPPIPSGTKKADQPADCDGGYLSKCPACGARASQSSPLGRFVSYTDAPLEVMLDSLFELLPDSEPNWQSEQPTRRKILTFSDGRQDAAFFASDFQRTHTETLYRQMVWRSFQAVNQDKTGIASVKQVEEQLTKKFLEISLPHPDRRSELHHLSYVPNDPDELAEDARTKNPRDCRERSQARAKELLLREFGLPSARRFSLEAMGLLSCQIDFHDPRLPEAVAGRFNLSPQEARVFLRSLTNIIRQAGIVDLQGASDYFPETGGVEGVRPGVLDSQGRTRTQLKLQKDKGETNVVSFLWRTNEKTGEPTTLQNHLVAYYQHILGRNLSREDITWLYHLLVNSGWLTKCQSGGHQLNWELLNIVESDRDWYQCNSCQQRFQLLGLGEIFETTQLGFKHCLAYKCKGMLQPWKISQNQDIEEEADHYRYLIRQRQILPLRSQEHTAQLSVVELEKRENRFRQGKINLLSSSTTLEMGVDIGELQAVALRNFPPHVSNYQQRVGRAGRRTDGVAVTLMYGQRRPHDRFYFDQPALLIAGKNQIPKLNTHNFQIQQRHIRAELLAEFLREQRDSGAENIRMAEFLDLSCQEFAPIPESTLPPDALLIHLREWLHSDRAFELSGEWLQRLGNHQVASVIRDEFCKVLSAFGQSQLQDWNQLAEVLEELETEISATKDRKVRREMEFKRDRMEEELEKIAKRRLHDELAQASILPIYGFPIDVVRLLTGQSNQHKSSQGRHRLERDRRLALGEYAPGQEIVVDDRVHRSVGILRPESLEHQYYWVCQNCNYFVKSKQEDPFDECPECKSSPHTASEQKMRAYVVPKTFTTDWSKLPKVTPHTKPLRQPTSQVFLAQDGDNPESVDLPHLYELTSSQGGLFFLANQGPLANGRGFKNRGFAICKSCGCDLSERVQERQRAATGKKGNRKENTTSTASSQIPHDRPLTGKPCSGKYYEMIHLGHEFRSDLLKIRLASSIIGNRLLYEPVIHLGDDRVISSVEDSTASTLTGLGFWYSLTYAFLAAAAQVIDVPRSEIDGLFKPREGGSGLAEIVIYDNVPGGAGYSKRIADAFKDVLEKAYELVESCSCDSSCYDCLRTYSNQGFHAQLNRHIVADFLKPLVEQVKPDPELKDFALNASRISLAKIAERLPALCRLAGATSLLYLPQLSDPFGLDRGSPLPWLKLLTAAIGSMQNSSRALELIVNQLPQPNSDSNRVLRKRLQQWSDQGLLKLYQTNVTTPLTLCLNTQQPERVALQLKCDAEGKPLEWFQTRSQSGVEKILGRLEELRSHSQPIHASELEDPSTFIHFLEPSRRHLSVSELRQELGLDRVLTGSKVERVTYRDRYLGGEEAKILVDLLRKELAPSATVKIWVLENALEQSASERKFELEAVLKELEELGISCQVSVQPQRQSRHFPHSRILEVHRQDGQQYKVVLDMGFDFLEARTAGMYCVTKPTYVVVTCQTSTVSR